MIPPQTETKLHRFERAGLGLAPFRCIGIESRVGPIDLGNGHFVGAPGQPMGTCAYCGTGIADCRIILSADKKRFIVGNECVAHTADKALISESKRFTRERDRAKRLDKMKRDEEVLKGVLADPSSREGLNALPHPVEYMAERGHTLLGYIEFMRQSAGASGMARAVRICRKNLPAKE